MGNSLDEWPEQRQLPFFSQMQPNEVYSKNLIARVRAKQKNVPLNEPTLDLLS